MAFNKRDLDRFDVDESDVNLWKHSNCTSLLVDQIKSEQERSLRLLLKNGSSKHDENAQLYNAYDKILTWIKDA